ncbi:MAG: hypothetical protein JMN25_17380 [gamma proteobacterium endosymbiont of Lamellibrachia anaximandri]|nr:hypothetical protein [gamma proteobacterium endosymbiont of Lamellibrachia anaximandri]
MPPILDLQRELHKAHCVLRYGTDNLRKLTQEDRDRLEIVVKIEEGSSVFTAEFWKELNETVKLAMNDMESKHKLILIISLALAVSAPVSWKLWLSTQERMKELEVSVQLEELENERIKLLTRAQKSYADVKKVTEGVDGFRNHTLQRLHPEDQFHMMEGDKARVSIDGGRATKVTQTQREKSVEIRLDGEFLIEEVRSGGIRGFRVKVKRVTDNKEITVSIPDGTLTREQLDTLKNNEWAKRPVLMKINAKNLQGRITGAVLVQANDIPKKKT